MSYLQNLNGKWLVRAGSPEAEAVAVTVPGSIAAVLPQCFDPVYYELRFHRRVDSLPGGRILLEFEKVDMRCEVSLNGVPLGVHLHAEEAFFFDVTDCLREENLLIARVSAPAAGHDPVDGMVLAELPNGGQALGAYTFVNAMGIKGGVSLRAVPAIRITDLSLRPDPETGRVAAEFSVFNAGKTADGTFSLRLSEHGSGRLCDEVRNTFSIPEGDSVHTVDASVFSPHLWSPNDPFLYHAEATLSDVSGQDTLIRRFGFRTLCVRNGYFFLNGKRIFIRSGHGWHNRDMIAAAKAAGFNMLRYLSSIPSPEVLDYADEIGMMVYEECYASWAMNDYPGVEKDLYAYFDNMVRRDRNHPSVTIWGLFNELPGGNAQWGDTPEKNSRHVFEGGVAYLPRLRELDPTRLVLLGSGRWDDHTEIGSYANPGADEWECGWGCEGDPKRDFSGRFLAPDYYEMGDIHYYPQVPLSPESKAYLRTLGSESKPVFYSEGGCGCQPDIVRRWREMLSNVRSGHPYEVRFRKFVDRFEQFLDFYALRGIYPFAEDYMAASFCKNVAQRIQYFDHVRANPTIAGYSMTSFSIGHEGVFYSDALPIPGMLSALKECWYPLRWSLFTPEDCLYADRPVRLEAVLCNEDVLSPGTYRARFAVTGPVGTVWEKTREVILPENGPGGFPPLAVPVLDITLPSLPAGEYTFAAELLDGRMPSGGRKHFRTVEKDRIPLPCRVGVYGLSEQMLAFLTDNGMIPVDPFAESCDLILAARGENTEALSEHRRSLFALAGRGACLVVLEPDFLQSGDTISRSAWSRTIPAELPFAKDAVYTYYFNWLYHLDGWSTGMDPIGAVAPRGLLDMEDLAGLYPDKVYRKVPAPDRTFSASFGADLIYEDGMLDGLTFGEYAYEKGKIVLNSFRIPQTVGRNPLADKLLLSLLSYYKK